MSSRQHRKREILRNGTCLAMIILAFSLVGCASTPNYVPRTPITHFDLDSQFFMKVGFDDGWRVYLESDPPNALSAQFQKLKELGLTVHFVALSKDGLFGVRCLSETTVLSFSDYIPLLKESIVQQGATPRNESAITFKNLSAQTWDYDVGDLTFHDLIIKNMNKFYRTTYWSTKQNFQKYQSNMEALFATIDVIHK